MCGRYIKARWCTPSQYCGLVLCVYLSSQIATVTNTETTDAAVPYMRWALVECATVIVCGSILAMRPLVKSWYPSLDDMRRSSKGSDSLYPDKIVNPKILMDMPRLSKKVTSYPSSKPTPPPRGISRDDIEEWERLLREGQARANNTVVMHPPPSSHF